MEVLDPARSQARHPLFQVMLTFQNLADAHLELPGLTGLGLSMSMSRVAKFDLQLTLSEGYAQDGSPDGLGVRSSPTPPSCSMR